MTQRRRVRDYIVMIVMLGLSSLRWAGGQSAPNTVSKAHGVATGAQVDSEPAPSLSAREGTIIIGPSPLPVAGWISPLTPDAVTAPSPAVPPNKSLLYKAATPYVMCNTCSSNCANCTSCSACSACSACSSCTCH